MSKHKKLQNKELNYIRSKLKEGYGLYTISKDLNYDRVILTRYLQKYHKDIEELRQHNINNKIKSPKYQSNANNQKLFVDNKTIKYINEQLSKGISLVTIAKSLNIKYSTLYNKLKKNHPKDVILTTKNNGKITNPNYKNAHDRDRFSVDKNILIDLYMKQFKSMDDIAKIYDVDTTTILNLFIKYNIKRRNKSDAGKLMYKMKPEVREKLRALANSGVIGIFNHNINDYANTWIEVEFENWCKNNKIQYETQFQIKSKSEHRYDFHLLNTNFIIECDGDFWHNTPKQQEKDNKFDTDASNAGYTVLRFTDKEIKDSKSKCFDMIKELI